MQEGLEVEKEEKEEKEQDFASQNPAEKKENFNLEKKEKIISKNIEILEN
jgi:hypothetical protein